MKLRGWFRSVILTTAFACFSPVQSAWAQQLPNFQYPQMTKSDSGDQQELRLPPPRLGFAQPPLLFRPVQPFGGSGTYGLSPAQTRRAYGFDKLPNQGSGQTVAIVDAYDHPSIESDLAVFSAQYGLAACTTANGCFRKIYASGKQPKTDAGWALEIALDVEWVHAIAPQARIILVEAATNGFGDLFKAVDVAVKNGASVVSMSWGAKEWKGEKGYDSHFSINGVTFTVSSGDRGTGAAYPAASTLVVAVGGTSLSVDGSGNYTSETAWKGSGGGVSAYENAPTFQATYPVPSASAGKRGIPDVSYNGNPSTGFSIYDTVPYSGYKGWFMVGGTSAGAPQWAALFAIANSTRTAARKRLLNATPGILYTLAKSNYAGNYYDVTSGTNGKCGSVCTAAARYDYVTGLGSPRADALISALVNQP